jgi:hypothetical protein
VFMITTQEWLNPTRATGLMAYGTALTCCGIAWIRTKTRRASQLAAVLMLIESALLLDMAFNWRWKLHQALMDFAIRKHEYGQRGLPQLFVVALLGALLLFGWFVAWRSFRCRGTTLLAVSGALLSLVVWCIEVVSLHAVDIVLYYSVDGVMAVTLLWLLSCTMTSIGILLDPW